MSFSYKAKRVLYNLYDILSDLPLINFCQKPIILDLTAIRMGYLPSSPYKIVFGGSLFSSQNYLIRLNA